MRAESAQSIISVSVILMQNDKLDWGEMEKANEKYLLFEKTPKNSKNNVGENKNGKKTNVKNKSGRIFRFHLVRTNKFKLKWKL